MNEQFVFGLVIGALAAVAALARVASRERRPSALSRIEAKLDTLLEHDGIRFDPFSDVPPTVHDALQQGKKIEAIKAYRLATGKGLKESKQYVEEVQRRASPRG